MQHNKAKRIGSYISGVSLIRELILSLQYVRKDLVAVMALSLSDFKFCSVLNSPDQRGAPLLFNPRIQRVQELQLLAALATNHNNRLQLQPNITHDNATSPPL